MKQVIVALLLCLGTLGQAEERPMFLTLESAVGQALAEDAWLKGSHHRENALQQDALAEATLPNPRLSVTAGSFPVDSFDIHQEGMTQLSLGIAQALPRGDSRALASRHKQELAIEESVRRQDRKAAVRAAVTLQWLEAFSAQERIRLIENDRSLFEQLVDAAQASYASALGRTRQQDLVRAQLELTRLDDRLIVLRAAQESAQQRLFQWIGRRSRAPLAPTLPQPSLATSVVDLLEKNSADQVLYEHIRHHPRLRALDLRLRASETDVELARQKFQPQWDISARYGYRADSPVGASRADLFTLGVSFDLPRLTHRADRGVNAALSRLEAMQTDQLLLRRELMADLRAAIVQLRRLNERSALYENRLLPQMVEQSDASLSAYNNDDGDFAEAVRARIAQLNARIEALTIAVAQQQAIAQINYLLTETADDELAVTE